MPAEKSDDKELDAEEDIMPDEKDDKLIGEKLEEKDMDAKKHHKKKAETVKHKTKKAKAKK